MEPIYFSVENVDAALPQTQCTRCGYPDCHSYAQAIVQAAAPINQCPPGGAEGVARLSDLTGLSPSHLNPTNGAEGPRQVAIIDEDWCIGCTLCIQACPVDCIVGAPKVMHTVIESLCTGCELCIPACPVDCIDLENVTGELTGWQAWSNAQAEQAKSRYAFHQFRLAREREDNARRLAAKAEHKLANLESLTHHSQPSDLERKRAVIEAAMARAKARQAPKG